MRLMKMGRASVGAGTTQVSAAAPLAAEQKAVVSSTGITDEKQLKEVARLATLGAALSIDDVSRCTHLVTAGKVLRTVKMLVAINKGCAIVGLAWVKECLREGRIVDAQPWAVQDAEMEQKFGFKLEQSLKLARSQPVFRGLTFYCTDNTLPTPEQLREIVESGGGTMKPLPKSGKIDGDALVVASEQDAAVCEKLRARFDGKFYVPEVVLSGVLKQKVELDKHFLKLKK